MIELIAARGNTSLESAVTLTKSLRYDIQSLARRLEKAANAEELARKGKTSAQRRAQNEAEIKQIIADIKRVLNRIEDAVPLMNLAITTSGATLSTSLPATVSPSRLLQASTFLTACDTQYSMSPSTAVQVGPTFTLSMYMLFAGHIRPHDEESVRETTWKEVIHKARVKLRRVPIDVLFDADERGSHVLGAARADEYAYQIVIVEDLDDGRVHDFEDGDGPDSYEGVREAGMREIIPVHHISKIFYADTGKMLNINTESEVNNPVLLLKRDVNAIPPRRILERQETDYADLERDEEVDEIQAQLDAQLNGERLRHSENRYYKSLSEKSIPDRWRLPAGLDPEWIAFEVYQDDEDDESETEADENPDSPGGARHRSSSINPRRVASLSLSDRHNAPSPSPSPGQQVSFSSQQGPGDLQTSTVSNPLFSNIRTSLSLLEMLLRLTSLQQFQQQSHLSITDELLNFFLEESSSTGAGGDENYRQRLRAEARRKVGWDPYDESPVKRRGEDYQYRYPEEAGYDEGAEHQWTPTVTATPDRKDTGLYIRSRENTPDQRTPSPGLPPRRRQKPGRLSVDGQGVPRRGSPHAARSTISTPDQKRH